MQALFDDIEYGKGGSVLRMLWNYMSSAHYASARLPPDTQPGHAANVSPQLHHIVPFAYSGMSLAQAQASLLLSFWAE